MAPSMRFTTVVTAGPNRRVLVPVPFDPDEAWGFKPEHHVAGTVSGKRVRGVVERGEEGWAITLGAAWRRDCGIHPGTEVDVVLVPEGPQRADLAPDLAAALDADPEAGAFFDGLATFYRKGYLRWINATARRPEVRAERIAEVVRLCRLGCKERPRAGSKGPTTPAG